MDNLRGQTGRCMHITLAVKRLRQKDWTFEVSLCYKEKNKIKERKGELHKQLCRCKPELDTLGSSKNPAFYISWRII